MANSKQVFARLTERVAPVKYLRRFLPPVVVLMAMGCNDTVAPDSPVIEPGARASLHHLRWAEPMGADRFTSVLGTPNGETQLLPFEHVVSRDGGPTAELSTYQVSFWAVKGQDRYVEISYLDAAAEANPYLRFAVSAMAMARRPDGSWISVGDSVLITITVDSLDMVAEFQPSGLTFKTDNSAVLDVWYGGASNDFNTDGAVNGTDADIEANYLGVWTRDADSDPWVQVYYQHDLSAQWFNALVPHFSGYAVSW